MRAFKNILVFCLIAYLALAANWSLALAAIIFYLSRRPGGPPELFWGFLLDLGSSFPFGFFSLLILILVSLSNLAKNYIKEQDLPSQLAKLAAFWLVSGLVISSAYLFAPISSKLWAETIAIKNSLYILMLLILFLTGFNILKLLFRGQKTI